MSEQELITPHQNEQSPAIKLLENALASPDVPSERIDKALDWLERLEKKEAIAEFNMAFAQMQADLPTVPKNGKAHQNARYALLEDIIKISKPVLTANGFALNWTNEIDQQAKTITVTAWLRHCAGHAISNVGIYPFDGSGSKNAIQAVGSAESYGRRYTATALLGIATGDADDDGNASSGVVTADQADEIATLLDTTGADVPAFMKFARVNTVYEIPSAKFETYKALILRKKQEA